MTESVYNALSDADKKRFTFVDAALPVYKQLNADGSFGKLNNKSVSFKASNVTLSTGFDARFDQYLIKIDDVDFSSLKDTTNKLAYLWGGVITTTDGSKYGMIPLNNLWLNSAEFGFSISEFKEAHGYDVRYQHTTDLEGKTIKNVTYLAKDKENISVDLNVYVKNSTNATVVANTPKAGADVTVDLTFSNIPSDANYKVSAVKSGSGKAAKALTEEQYSYSDGKLVLKGEVAVGTYTISFADDKYVNIGTAITVE